MKLLMETTDNSSIYKKARKRYLEGRGISCVFCGYHKGENTRHKYQRTWKKTSKRKRQFKSERNTSCRVYSRKLKAGKPQFTIVQF